MSSLYEETLYNIKQNKIIKDSGKLLAIPFHRMPKLSTVLPGIRKNQYTIITSGTKEAKTQLADFMFLHQPIEFLKDNPNSGLDIKIKYFSLEISKEDKLAQSMSYKLYSDYGISISPLHLMSVFQGYTLDKQILDIIESGPFKEYFEFFETKVEIIDNIKAPTSIMINMENYNKSIGKLVYEDVRWDDGSIHKIIKEYVPNNPNLIVEGMVDHATLLSEKGRTLYDCIKTLSSDYFMKLKNTYKNSLVLIQQQNADSTTQQFTNRGETILDKVKPSREGLTGCKDTGQDCTLMLGIFSPFKYKETSYEGWDLTRLRDYHRELSIMLNRHGRSNITQQLFFNGASSFFKELPPEMRADNKVKVYNAADAIREAELKYTN